jgi:hypothetical protein
VGDFCTIQDVEEFLQLSIEDDAALAASCQRAITAATAAIRNYCHQYLELVEDDEWTFDVRPARWNLLLPELPVVAVSAVLEDGEALTVDDDYKLGLYGQLWRVGRRWEPGVQIVTVTYDHGYATIPDDIVDVCTRAAARTYQAGLKSADAEGIPGISSKSLGDFSVSFTGETGGGVGEGVMGASASRMLLLSEKDMLDKYRYVGP